MPRLATRLSELERSASTSDASDRRLLVSLLARRDALFWPWRHHDSSRLGIHQRQREYLSGACGIAAKADGKSGWKPMFEARQRLIQAGMLTALYSGGQVTSMFLSPLGEATARSLVGDRLYSLREVSAAYDAITEDSWTSESLLFSQNLVGDPKDWEDSTELVLPLLVAGLVVAGSDTYGRVGYRRTDRELPPDEPLVDIACDDDMDSVYMNAFNSERDSLTACEPFDSSEILIPLSTAALKNYEPAETK